MKKVITTVNEEITTLITGKKQLKFMLRRNNSQRTYKNIISFIHPKLKTMETSIKSRHKQNCNVTMLMLQQREKIKGKVGTFPEINFNGKNVKKGKKISAVSKKELKRFKKTHLTKTLLICQQENTFTKICFSKRASICTYTNKC